MHCIGQQTGGFLDLERQRITKMPDISKLIKISESIGEDMAKAFE